MTDNGDQNGDTAPAPMFRRRGGAQARPRAAAPGERSSEAPAEAEPQAERRQDDPPPPSALPPSAPPPSAPPPAAPPPASEPDRTTDSVSPAGADAPQAADAPTESPPAGSPPTDDVAGETIPPAPPPIPDSLPEPAAAPEPDPAPTDIVPPEASPPEAPPVAAPPDPAPPHPAPSDTAALRAQAMREAKAAQVAVLMTGKLGLRGDDLAAMAPRARRRLPARRRRQLNTLVAGISPDGPPPGADRFDRDHRRLQAWLEKIDPARDRARRRAGLAATIAFQILVVIGLLLAFLGWQGFL